MLQRIVLGLAVLLGGVATLATADEVADLVKKLGSSDSSDRRDAASKLAEPDVNAKPAVKALIKALKDEDRFVRRYAAQALGNVGVGATEAIPALAGLLKDDRENVREAAVQALSRMGSSAVPALAKGLQGASSDVQEGAIKALARTGDSGVPTLTGLVRDPKVDSAIRRRAVEAVLGLGAKSAKSAIPALLDAAKATKAVGREGRQLRLDAITGLGQLATKSDGTVVTYLGGLANDEKLRDMQLKNTAKGALKKIEGRK